ncbi:MAG: sensor histidine kinase [Lachnospiraceae bacterium]|nr:sensor histidine kinase [Lachnospiraceae bacterium]
MNRKNGNRGYEKGSLMKNSIRILVGILCVILLAFVSNYVIINNWYQRESIRSREDFFRQVVERIGDFTSEIQNLSYSATSTGTVIGYLQAQGLDERWGKYGELTSFTANLMKLDDDIIAVSVYDKEGQVVGTQGTRFAPISEDFLNDGEAVFSGAVEVYGESGYFFQVRFPVYEKTRTGAYYEAGNVILLHNTGELERILDLAASAYSEESSYVAVLDRGGKILADSGNAQVWEKYESCGEGEEKRFLDLEEELAGSGWSIRYVTMRKSYMDYMNKVQIINIFTYVVTIAAVAWMCYMNYRKVIKPIRKQMAFVVGYTQDTSQRIEISDNKEFGELEKEINEMLDGIEELNRRIIEGEKRYLELGYAKKQTEMIAYRNQINPHFMYNTLECIRGMALYHGEKEIAKLTAAMAKMFRYNVKGNEIVAIRDVLQCLKEYAVIIEYRFMGRIEIRLDADENIMETEIPKMLVQPLVENAVRHGVEPRVDKGRVVVEIERIPEGRIRIRVSDNGFGMNPEILEEQRRRLGAEPAWQEMGMQNHGIGIQNVFRRIKLFYGEDGAFVIDSVQGEGTCITMELPERVG